MSDVTTVPWVVPEKLGNYAADRLGGGGQGIVYGVPDPQGRLAGQYLAFKEYLPNVRYDADVLHDLVCFRLRLDPAERAHLDDRLAWPSAMVYRGEAPTVTPPSRNPRTKVVGFLMPRVTAAYELRSPQLPEVKQQALEFLLNPDSYGARIGLHVDDAQRVGLLLDLARTVDRLHRHGVAVGDLSPKNVLFTLNGGQGRCLLIDCDSMRYQGRDVLQQVDTPGWEVPEPEKATVFSDSWKFGLLAARVFNRDQDDRDPGPLRAISTELANLAVRGQNQDPQRRPALSEWLPALELAHSRAKRSRRATAHTTQPPAPGPTPVNHPRPRQQPAAAPQGFVLPAQLQPNRPARTGSTGSRVGGWLLAAALVGGLVGYAATHMDSTDGTPSSVSTTATGEVYTSGDPGSGSTTPETTPDTTDGTPSDRAVATGATVDYSQVADDSAAEGVAGMFAHFFGAINEQDYEKALKYYDPDTSVLNLGSTSSRNKWADVMSTTRDTDFVLGDLSSDGTYTLATLNFTSHQDAGYGPAGSPSDTCDRWTVTYQLTHSAGYRIYKAPRDGVSYTSC
ncbi:lipopolysaccharide kinase InaA family protein [Streptomyces sp. NPDC058964]|uniref:lipopolysaccharide kinase InaA family protein n=1 Tax=Streptomyces sp. NPDC058964 TaxID=3346681 RepID=UPI0036A1FF5E